MAFECKIPELGENIESGTVASILVSVGDQVEKDQSLVELETEKAVVEVPSEAAGTVKEIRIKEGEDVKVGQTIVVLDSEAQSADTAQKEGAPEPTPEPEPAAAESPKPPAEAPKSKETQPSAPAGKGDVVEVNIPDLGENIESGTVANVLVNVGDSIELEQSVVELETEKAVVEVPSTAAGTVKEILVKSGQEVKVGQAIISVETSEAPAAPQEQPAAPAEETAPKKQEPAPAPAPQPEPVPTTAAPAPPPMPEPSQDRKVPAAAAPSVRRFAREIGVDIHKVPGTGPGNRITIDDVKQYSKQMHQSRQAAPSAAGAPVQAEALPDFTKWGDIERQAMSKVREKTAVHLSNAWATIPHVTQYDKADITELEALRKQYGPQVQEAGGKLTMTAILLKVVAAAMKTFPQFNASVDLANREIVYKKYFSIGVAVDTDRGLLVPVIRDVNRKNLIDLSVELTQIAEKARDRKLSLEDMQGGNFTISNLGGLGGTSFAPIINAPEVAILGVSRGAFEPVYKNGEFEPRLMLPLSLSYDHRIIDGADGVRFLRWIVEALEQPFTMLLEG